jgi:endo-1,3-1,4-beta-glycanase ExoK
MGAKEYAILGLGMFAAVGTAGAATLDGGELYSNETVKYGRWEIRMQVAATPGTVSTFFTYYNNSYLGQPEPWREIDIEVLGKDAKSFQSNLLTGHAAQRTTSEAIHTSVDDLTKGFHTYELDWTPDSVVFRLDGKTVRSTPGTNQQVKDLQDKEESYRMNLWASTEPAWVGTLDPSKLPVVQTVNWMAYSAFTPGQGPGGSDFSPRWTDDFTTLNTTRWSKANWTFEGNMADFVPGNIKVENGYLMLILSNKGWTGTVPPASDPQGSTRPTVSLLRRGSAPGIRTDFSRGAMRSISGAHPGGFVVFGPDGRIHARHAGSAAVEIGSLPGSILFLRGSAGTEIIPIQ